MVPRKQEEKKKVPRKEERGRKRREKTKGKETFRKHADIERRGTKKSSALRRTIKSGRKRHEEISYKCTEERTVRGGGKEGTEIIGISVSLLYERIIPR